MIFNKKHIDYKELLIILIISAFILFILII